MGAPAVQRSELDLSARVPSFPGPYCGIAIPAPRGPVNSKVLVTSDTKLLNDFTPNGKIEVGHDLSFFSALTALQKTNKMWTVRAAKDALYGGLSLKTISSSTDNFALPAGLVDPSAYVFDDNPDVEGVAEVTEVTCPVASTLDFNGVGRAWQAPGDLHYIWYDVTDGANTQTDPGLTGTAVKVDVVAADTAIQVAVKTAAALAALTEYSAPVPTTAAFVLTKADKGDVSDAVDVNAGVTFSVTTQGVDEVDVVDEAILIYGTNQGIWNDDIKIKVTTYTTNPDYVKVAGAFVIDVYYRDNVATPVESFTLSRVQGLKDGYGRNMYVEDRLLSSKYIRAIDNILIANTVLPKDQATVLALNGGDNGSAVTDAEMIVAVDALKNPDSTLLTVIMDGGWATVNYQQHLATLAENRDDSFAVLSTPFSAEDAADYMTEVVNYRKTTLALNSSYAGIYAGSSLVYDRFNDRDIYISPDGFAAAAICETAATEELWFPAAGWKRGRLTIKGLRREYDQGEMDLLYDNGINPFRYKQGKGFAIWGQKTLWTTPSALDRIHVRMLLIVIKPAVAEALEDFLFELNDPAEQGRATGLVTTYMGNIQGRTGVYAFRVVCSSDNNDSEDVDAHRMNLWLFVKPAQDIEYVPFKTIITSTGLDFTLAEELV